MLANEDGSVLAAYLPLLQTAFSNILALSMLLQCEWGRCGFGAKVCMEPHFHRHSSFLSGPSAAADTALKDLSIAKQLVCPQSFCSGPSGLQAETAAFTFHEARSVLAHVSTHTNAIILLLTLAVGFIFCRKAVLRLAFLYPSTYLQ